jgi:hypothetical protein
LRNASGEDGYLGAGSERTLIWKELVVRYTPALFYISRKVKVMAVPIWKDYYVNFGNVDSIDYEIRLETLELVYSGRAVRRPDQTELKVKINNICADYLKPVIMNLEEGFASNEIAKTFNVYDGFGSHIDSVTFVNDWSYDYDKQDDGVVSVPINGIFDVRMPLLYSISRGQTIKIDIQDEHADFNIDFSADFYIGQDSAYDVVAGSAGTLTLKNVFDRNGEVKIGDTRYKGITSCCKYALYYINAYGGWDFLLIQGNSSESDAYSRKEYTGDYNNSDVANRGIKNYQNDVNKKFVLNTGWLSDQSSMQMHHLLGSTEVFMYDLEKQVMIPVVIEDQTCAYKTFKTEGGKLVNYEVSVRVAKEMIRR